MKAKKAVIERIAKAGFERMFDEQWEDLHEKALDRVLWREIASDMLDVLSLMAEEGKKEKP